MRTLLHHGTHLGAGAEDFSRDTNVMTYIYIHLYIYT
jgi:hypothetical protein